MIYSDSNVANPFMSNKVHLHSDIISVFLSGGFSRDDDRDFEVLPQIWSWNEPAKDCFDVYNIKRTFR